MIDELRADAQDALESLREMTRGACPPILADEGLVAALAAEGETLAACPSRSKPTSIGRIDDADRGGRLLLLPRSDAERREVRERRPGDGLGASAPRRARPLDQRRRRRVRPVDRAARRRPPQHGRARRVARRLARGALSPRARHGRHGPASAARGRLESSGLTRGFAPSDRDGPRRRHLAPTDPPAPRRGNRRDEGTRHRPRPVRTAGNRQGHGHAIVPGSSLRRAHCTTVLSTYNASSTCWLHSGATTEAPARPLLSHRRASPASRSRRTVSVAPVPCRNTWGEPGIPGRPESDVGGRYVSDTMTQTAVDTIVAARASCSTS